MIFEAIKVALTSIWDHKIRSFLTVLGIIIGIGSVVMFMAVGEGLRVDVNNEITALGSNLVTVVPGEFDAQSGAISTSIISGDILTTEDVEALENLPSITAATPYMLFAAGTLRHEQSTAPQAYLLGTTSNATQTFTTIQIKRGRLFTEQENENRARVIVLGPAIAETLFGDEDGLGKEVMMGDESLTVVGITKVPDSTSFLGGSDYSLLALMPIRTAGDIGGGVKIMRIVAAIDPDIDASGYVPTIEHALEANHAAEDFTVLTQEDLLDTVNSVLTLLTAAIAGIAAISLVVAGVGIMNIMLVSVTERTKEIGIRKAVGATTGAILWQFLIESIVLSVSGALMAVGLAWIAAELAAEYSPLTPVVTPEAVMLAVGVGVTVGLAFGIAPAYRAAKLDPIKALRYE